MREKVQLNMAQYIKLVFVACFALTDAFTAPSNFKAPASQLNAANGDKQNSSPKLTYGEESRPYRRTVYTPDDWVKHRDPDRFFRDLLTTFDSGVVVQITKEVSVVTTIALTALLWNAFAVDGYCDLEG